MSLTTIAPAVTVTHVDTCLSCYLTDHHNRPGELLVGVPVTRATRNHRVRAGIIDEAIYLIDQSGEDGPTRLAIGIALDAVFAGRHPLASFDKSLDVANDSDECAECCQAWFLLQWQPGADDDAIMAPALVSAEPDTSLADFAAKGPAHAEAAAWLDFVSDATRYSGGVAGFDASVTEAVDTLLRRQCITPRAATVLLAFFDVAPAVSAPVAAAALTARQQSQQPQSFDLRAGPGVTTRDLTLSHHSAPFILPAGTRVVGVRDGLGTLKWAVASEKLVRELSGNAHDARHRYCFVPGDAVRPGPVPTARQQSQQPQARDTRAPQVGPSVYEAGAAVGARIAAALRPIMGGPLRPAWAAPVVTELHGERRMWVELAIIRQPGHGF